MKAKLVWMVAIIVGCVVGYWIGAYHTRKVWNHLLDAQVHKAHQYHNWVRVSVDTKVLQYLADGKQGEARSVLERQLDVAVVQVVAYEKLYYPERRDSLELHAVQSARDYRSAHPWTSEPDKAEAVQQAFRWPY